MGIGTLLDAVDLMPPAGLSSGTTYWLTVVWLFAVGCAVGSFLNVVIYRLPAGMSLVRPGSHCPTCKRPIRWFDNVPILSWFVLRGRCRDCRAKISPRYPAVEAITAVLFLLLGVRECLSGGANLPPPEPDLPQAWAVYVYHLVLLCTLVAAVLIEYDGHRLPMRLFAPALIVGLAAPLVWPRLHPVHAWPALDGWPAGLTDGPAGLAAGLVLGWLASGVCGPRWTSGLLRCPACVGLFLGWQAVVVLTIATMAIHLFVQASGRFVPGIRRLPPTAWLAVGGLGWILAWEPLVRWIE